MQFAYVIMHFFQSLSPPFSRGITLHRERGIRFHSIKTFILIFNFLCKKYSVWLQKGKKGWYISINHNSPPAKVWTGGGKGWCIALQKCASKKELGGSGGLSRKPSGKSLQIISFVSRFLCVGLKKKKFAKKSYDGSTVSWGEFDQLIRQLRFFDFRKIFKSWILASRQPKCCNNCLNILKKKTIWLCILMKFELIFFWKIYLYLPWSLINLN